MRPPPGDHHGDAPTAGPSGQLRRQVSRALEEAERGAGRISSRFTSPLHDQWVASVLGIALGVTFPVCFVTGLVDYLAQHPPSWFHLPLHPVDLFGITQGVHVVTGIATIPLLLAKLWTVWPKLFSWPPLESIAHALERLSLIALVGGALFELFTGVINIDYWYSPMPYFFPTAHFWAAWLVVGALVVHVGAKGATATAAISRGHQEGRTPRLARRRVTAVADLATVDLATTAQPAEPAGTTGLSRRGFITMAFAAAGALVLSSVGEAFSPLQRLAVLAPRNPRVGPQHLPVNQSAVEAGVTESAVDPGYRLAVEGNCRRPRSFSLDELRALPQRAAALPITCVEGWSASARWRGVSLPVLLRLVGAPASPRVRVESLEAADRLYSSSVVDAPHATDPDTLLALELNGGPLDLDHGYPVRLIAPDRPGVLQTKWVARVVVL